MYSFIQIFTNFCILFFILLVEKSCAAHFQYEACAPRACGGLHIKFPFYIRGLQESYCGLTEFELNCSNSGSPAIHIPENNYVIDRIFYEIQTFRVHNTVASSIRNCLPEIGNITLNDRFDSVNASNIHLLSSCKNNSLPEVLRKYRKVACDENRKDEWGLAMLEGDENLNKALEECEKNVLAPVEVHGDGGGPGSNDIMDYEELLRRGFELSWKDSQCRRCELSGGRCGFNESNYQFWCFCPDRPHRMSCKFGDPRFYDWYSIETNARGEEMH